MLTKHFKRLLLAMSLLAPSALIQAQDSVDGWDFRVFLDDSEVGYHKFMVAREQDAWHIQSEASFQVKLWFINAYQYEHEAEERWQGGCLRRIRARTNDNGEISTLSGSRLEDHFLVDNGAGADRLPSCVQSFAYWNLEFLDSGSLLNPQTGEYSPVALSPLGPETLTVEGRDIAAEVYRLMVDGRRIDLWYAANGHRWLALEAETEGGRVLRYQPASASVARNSTRGEARKAGDES